MIFEEQPIRSNSRLSTMATKFFSLGGMSFISLAEFDLRSRDDLKSFTKALDQDTHKPFDIFFVCEDFDLSRPYNQPQYFAVLTWFLGVKQSIEVKFTSAGCSEVRTSSLSVEGLFGVMSERSFIEIDLFQRLGRADSRTLRKTSNPFLQLYLSQNVSSAVEFIQKQLPKIPNLHFYPQTTKFISAEQTKLSKILFGAVQPHMIHLTASDALKLDNLSVQLAKNEIKDDEQSMMKDEDEEFQDVSYTDFEADSSLPKADLAMLLNLKEMRMISIRELKEKCRDQERGLQRWDSFERLR